MQVHEANHLELPAPKAKRGKASLLTNTIQISIFVKNEEDGKEEEIGKGWSVGKYLNINASSSCLVSFPRVRTRNYPG